ncbi:MAG: ABC transporter permease [Armatimonadetes bacterium]|nr:ABC transporter permease [Armatimonadota bacterium]
MSVLGLALREIRHRSFTFVLGVIAVAASVGLFAAMITLGRASNTETTRLMRNLGFNLLILPGDADIGSFWAMDDVESDMPEEYTTRLAQTKGISADHYVSTLQKRVNWQGMTVLVTGVLKEQTAAGARTKAPMGTVVEPGKCIVGYAICRKLGLREGDEIELLGQRLTVERCLAEDGSEEDVRIWTHLRDAQKMFNMPGRINMIRALGCLCQGGSLEILRDEIAGVLPDTYVTELRNIVVARTETRKMVESYVGLIVAVVVVVCAAWVGLLSLLNVRERRHEIGLLRALGFGSGPIAGLFITRAALMGLIGALIGFGVGTWLALELGEGIFKITFKSAAPAWDTFLPLVLGAPVLAAVAGLLPAVVAVTQDPAAVLTEE